MEHFSGSQAPGLTYKNYTELGRYVKDKHSSLFELFSKEKNCVIDTRAQCYKTFLSTIHEFL